MVLFKNRNKKDFSVQFMAPTTSDSIFRGKFTKILLQTMGGIYSQIIIWIDLLVDCGVKPKIL